jgi:hypothetical protein
MRAALRPLHLLAFAEAFAHHLIHRGLDEPRGNRFAMTIPLAIVRNQVAVIPNICAEFFHSFAQLLELQIRLFKVVDQRLDIINLVKCLVHIPMLQRPLQPLDFVSDYFAEPLMITVYQAFAVLVEDGKTHREVMPVENVLGLWTHIELQLAHRVAAI